MEKVKLHTRMYGWKHVWLEFADEFAGSVDDPNPDSSQTGMSIMISVNDGSWVLVYTLDPGKNGKQGHTLVQTKFAGNGNFKFSLHPHKQLNPFTKLFGMHDTSTGDKDFDKHFQVKGSEPNRLKDLFAHNEIRSLITDEPTIEISVQPDSTDSIPSPRILAGEQHMLSLKIPGIVDDFERLKNLYKIAGLLVLSLCTEDSPITLTDNRAAAPTYS